MCISLKARPARAGSVALCTGLLGCLAATAHAANIGGAQCGQSDCTVTAVTPGTQRSDAQTPAPPGVSHRDPNASTIVPGVPDRCLVTWTPPAGMRSPRYASLDTNPADGVWYASSCAQFGNGPGVPTFFQGFAQGGAAKVPITVVAQRAEQQLKPLAPVVESSPGNGAPLVVQLPTWVWIAPGSWAPVSATASVPGESVTATATPVRATWSWGDGISTVCAGPGTPFTPGVSDPAAASPTCGHTYHVTSGRQPGLKFPVTATVSWSVSWSGAGRSGVLQDLTTSATVWRTVEQVQSVIVR